MNENGHLPQCEGNPRSIKVLMYHRIVNDRSLSSKYWMALHVDDFRRQLELLDQWGFTPMLLRDFQLYLDGKLDLPRRPVVLTFDDGYSDFYELAYPLLQQYDAKAMVFVLGEKKLRTNFWDRQHGIPETGLMDGRQIVELHEQGFEIGSHTLSHSKLTSIAEDKLWEEVSRSRMLLEMLIDAPVESFSYPYGLLNPYVKNAVKDAGYQFACSVGTGPAAFSDDLLEIRRITIPSSIGVAGFALRLLTPYQYVEWTKQRAGATLHTLLNGGDGTAHARSSAHDPQLAHPGE